MDKKEQILAAAKQLILQKGYSKVSVQDITNELGISKGSFYTYFKSKSDMIQEMIQQKISIIQDKQEKAFQEAKTMQESLEKYLESCFQSDVENLEIQLVILNLFKNLEVVEEDIVNRLIYLEKKHIHRWESELEKYQYELAVNEKERAEYARLISKMIQGFTISTLFATEDEKFFIRDINEAVSRMEEKKTQEKIRFLVKNIMKMVV